MDLQYKSTEKMHMNGQIIPEDEEQSYLSENNGQRQNNSRLYSFLICKTRADAPK